SWASSSRATTPHQSRSSSRSSLAASSSATSYVCRIRQAKTRNLSRPSARTPSTPLQSGHATPVTAPSEASMRGGSAYIHTVEARTVRVSPGIEQPEPGCDTSPAVMEASLQSAPALTALVKALPLATVLVGPDDALIAGNAAA